MEAPKSKRPRVRKRANEIKSFRCKNLIAVIENPENPENIGNIGTVIRNVNALGVEKIYIVDPASSLPDDWQNMRYDRALSKTSVSAVKWTFVKRFQSTETCIEHLKDLGFESIVIPLTLKAAKILIWMRRIIRTMQSLLSGLAMRKMELVS